MSDGFYLKWFFYYNTSGDSWSAATELPQVIKAYLKMVLTKIFQKILPTLT